MPIFVMGLDLGQAQDFTAQVICQATGTQYDTHLVGLPLTQCDVRYGAKRLVSCLLKAVSQLLASRLVPERTQFLAVPCDLVGHFAFRKIPVDTNIESKRNLCNRFSHSET